MNRRRFLTAMAGPLLLVVAACSPAPGPLGFDPPTLPDAHVGVAYDARIDIAGNATPVGGFSISDGALPTGLSIERVRGEDAAGHIFGTPTTPGTVTFTVSVWCYGTNVGGQTGNTEYSITVR